MKISVTWVMAALPVLVRALAIDADTGPGNHLEERNPIYPTKVTVRALPAYPTRVTVRAKRDVEVTPIVADQGDVEGEAVKGLEARAPPKITLKTVKARRDTGGCTLKSTTVRTISLLREASVADKYFTVQICVLRGYANVYQTLLTGRRRRQALRDSYMSALSSWKGLSCRMHPHHRKLPCLSRKTSHHF